MATHWIDFGDHGDIGTRVSLGDRDCRPQSGASTTNQQNVMRRGFHLNLRLAWMGLRLSCLRSLLSMQVLITLSVAPSQYQDALIIDGRIGSNRR
jgi:hypothetical protein